MKKLFHLTQDGVNELKKELSELISHRSLIADRIRQARELGDLSENAEYQTAREEQDRLETRIGELENILQNIKLIKKPSSNGHVRLGSTVNLKSSDGKTQQFQIVGTMEADPLVGKISDESPIGKTLLGKKEGDKTQIKTASNNRTYTIVSIS